MSFVKSLLRTKAIEKSPEEHGLKRCLTAFDLTTLGIGAIIGAGIFVLTGVAAATQAGPAIIFSYILAGLACAFAAFSYAELAASIGGCGSAYGYSYAVLGEFIAWIIGWDLLLEYLVSSPVIAMGWSGYIKNTFTAMGFPLPIAFCTNPFEGGIVNLPAIIIILFITALLAMGVKESVRINKIMVLIKIAIIAFFIVVAGYHFNPSTNWRDFLPFGWQGVAKGAGLVFFAYIGFDAVSTAAEETVNPRRDLPIGIIASLVICTVLYILVSGLLTAAVPYTALNVSSPISYALLHLGYRFGGMIVALGAIIGLTTTIFVMYFGLTRICFAMSRDGLLPAFLSHVNPKTRTPVRIIVTAGVFMSLIGGFLPLSGVAEVVNIGTLSAFALVCLGVIWLRYKRPDIHRPFKTPFSPFIPLLGMLFCGYLMINLSGVVWRNFLIWMAVGLVIYFCYSRSHSTIAKRGKIVKANNYEDETAAPLA